MLGGWSNACVRADVVFVYSAYERAGEAPNIDLRGEGRGKGFRFGFEHGTFFANTGPQAEMRLGQPKGQPDRRTAKHAAGEQASEPTRKRADKGESE